MDSLTRFSLKTHVLLFLTMLAQCCLVCQSQTLEGVEVTSDIEDRIYVIDEICELGAALASIRNSNSFQIRAIVTNSMDASQVYNETIEADSILVVSFPKSAFPDDTFLNFNLESESGDTYDTTLELRHGHILLYLNVTGSTVDYVGYRNILVWVGFGHGITFTLEVYYEDETYPDTRVHTPSDPTSKNVTFAFDFEREGEYLVVAKAESSEGLLNENLTVYAYARIPDLIILTEGGVEGFDDEFLPFHTVKFSLSTSTPESIAKPNMTCEISWGDGSDNITESGIKVNASSPAANHSKTYDTLGDFEISVTCTSYLDYGSKSKIIHMRSPVENATADLQENPVVLANGNDPLTATIVIEHPGLDSPLTSLQYQIDFEAGIAGQSFSFDPENNRHLYVYAEKGVYSVNVTFSSYGLFKNMTLTAQIGLVDIYIENKLSNVQLEEDITFIIVSYNTSLSGSVSVDFGDDSDPLSMLLVVEITQIQHQFYVPGQKIVTATWNGDTSEYLVLVSLCFSSGNLFERTYRDIATPMRALLSMIPPISGRILLSEECSNATDIHYFWQVQKNTGVAPAYIWQNLSINVPSIIQLVLNEVIHEVGMYRIQLRVEVEDEYLDDTMHLSVEYAGLVASVGGSILQQVLVGSDILLNATASYDPSDPSGERPLSFLWKCFLVSSMSQLDKYAVSFHQDDTYEDLPDCTIPEIAPVATTTLSSSGFQAGTAALLEVIVTSDDNRNAFAVLIVHFVDQRPPQVFLDCVWNCERKLVSATASDRTLMEPRIECPECTREVLEEASYLWKIYTIDKVSGDLTLIPAEDWAPEINSESTSRVFDSSGGWWERNTNYKISLDVQVADLYPGRAERILFTNSPPRNGTCAVEPAEGVAGRTDFHFVFPDWLDEGERPDTDPELDKRPILTFEVQQKPNIKTPSLYIGGEVSTPWKKLVACGTGGHVCDLVVTVMDRYYGVATCNMKVNVTAFIDLSGSNQGDNLQGVLNSLEEIESALNYTIRDGDFLHIAQETAMYATVIGDFESVVGSDEVLSVDVTQVDSENFLDDLLNPTSDFDPDREKVVNTVEGMVDNIHVSLNEMVREDNLKSPNQLRVFASSMATTMDEGQPFLRGEAVEKATDAAETLSDKLVEFSNDVRGIREIESTVGAVGDLMSGIIDSMDYSAADLEPNVEELGSNNTRTPQELQFMAESIARRRRYKMRSKIRRAPAIARKCRNVWDNLFDVMRKFKPVDNTYVKTKRNFEQGVRRVNRKHILENRGNNGQGSSSEGTHSILSYFSVEDVVVEDDLEDLNIQVVKTKNIFTYGDHSKYITSDVVIGSVATNGGEKLQMTAPKIEHTTEDECSKRVLAHITPAFIQEDASHFFYHQFSIRDSNALVCVKVFGEHNAVFYRLYAKVGSEPSDIDYDYRKTLSLTEVTTCIEVCIPKGKLNGIGDAYIGLRPIFDESQSVSRKKRSTATAVDDPLISPYWFGVTSVACYSWDDQVVDWVASKCTMERNGPNVTCTCDGSSEIISGVSFSFAPNTIHFGTVFSKFDIENQAAVLGVLLSIYFLCALLAVWAHYMDRKSIFKWGVFPMVDNYAEDNYYYLISVHTGLRQGAGTTSKVEFSLAGEMHETGVRQLDDGVREGFPTGSIVHFVMACEGSLGPLQCLRIWHDNSGDGSKASWYLDKIVIVDLQTNYHYYFMNDEWLCPLLGCLDKVVHVSSETDLTKFQPAFLNNAKKHLTDDHIWLSVLLRPERSRFSRMERVACCLSFLLLSMIASAMFYNSSDSADRQQPEPDLMIGPLRFSLQQLYFSFVSAALTAIPIFAIVLLFKKARFISEEAVASKPKSNTGSKEKKNAETEEPVKCKEKMVEEGETTVNELDFSNLSKKGHDAENRSSKGNEDSEIINKERKSTLTTQCSKLPWMKRLEEQLKELQQILLIRPIEAEDLTGTWPYFCRYIGWFLIFTSVVVCSFFIVLYSMQWGKSITEEWLSTFFLAFLQSLLVVDPVKVVMISILLVAISHNMNFVDLSQVNLKVVSQVNHEYGIKEKPRPPRHMVSFKSALSPESLKEAVLRRTVNMLVRKVIRELLFHMFLFVVVASLCYNNRTREHFLFFKRISNALITPKYGGFKYINSTRHYHNWLAYTVKPWLLPDKDYSGKVITSEDVQFTADWDLYRLGAPRLRQVRMPVDACLTDRIPSKPCVHEYSIIDEQTEEYCIGWNDFPCPEIDKLRMTAGGWYFRSALDIWGVPIVGQSRTYGGGGYIQNLDINSLIAQRILTEVKDTKWINRHTRAVFLEFTLYCPNNDIFLYVMFLAEFVPMGGVLTFYNIYPFSVYDQPGALGTYVQVCQITGMVTTALGLFYVLYIFSKRKWSAFKDFWFMIDVILVLLAIVAVSFHVSRTSTVNTALGKMRDDPTQFVNFNQVVVMDYGLVTTLAFIMSLLCFRLLKLAAYSKRTMRVYEVLRLATKLLPSFSFYILLLIMSFMSVAVILFSSSSYYYRSVPDTLFVLFLGILGSPLFKVTGLPPSGYYVTLIYFTSFVMVITLCLTNLFLAVLMDLLTVSAQRDCAAVKSDEANVFQLLWESFAHLFCRKRDPVDTLRKNYEDEEKPPAEDVVAKEFEVWLERLGLTTSTRYRGEKMVNPFLRQRNDTSAESGELRKLTGRPLSSLSKDSCHSTPDPLIGEAKSEAGRKSSESLSSLVSRTGTGQSEVLEGEVANNTK